MCEVEEKSGIGRAASAGKGICLKGQKLALPSQVAQDLHRMYLSVSLEYLPDSLGRHENPGTHSLEMYMLGAEVAGQLAKQARRA